MPAEPEHIAVSKSKGIAIDWKDGQQLQYPLTLLRDECPCATCTGAHGTTPHRSNYQAEPASASPFQMYKSSLKIDRVEPIGNYAMRIYWNDGHNTGIYTWDFLRSLESKLPQGGVVQ